MQVNRVQYVVGVNSNKKNGDKPSSQDLLNIGYMSGKFGVDLNEIEAYYKGPNIGWGKVIDSIVEQDNNPVFTSDGAILDINSCTVDVFEDELNKMGMEFNRLS